MTENAVTTAPRRSRYGRWIALGVLVAVMAAGAALGVRWWHWHSPRAAIVGESPAEFPAIDRSTLDPAQVRLVSVLEREFAAPGDGTDYAEGVREPWCADFVSWAMREAGVPLANPNSGSWRIPGVYTLEEYYRSVDRFAVIDAGYRPRTGDVLLYSENSPFTQHTNIVLTVDDGVVTTIGGNEFGEVRIHRFALAEIPGVVGIGRF
ncbi:CHAP domain-containing protein [Nocardia sp. NPDC050710]|uniref:CHAP domain-containing protein n=1 Tax=Nocardia sp. NPDC050710 TaxID=3157220 RepID=UPI003410F580